MALQVGRIPSEETTSSIGLSMGEEWDAKRGEETKILS